MMDVLYVYWFKSVGSYKHKLSRIESLVILYWGINCIIIIVVQYISLVSNRLPLHNRSSQFLTVSSFSMQTRSFGKEFPSSMHLAGNAFCRKDFKHLGLFCFNEWPPVVFSFNVTNFCDWVPYRLSIICMCPYKCFI